MKTALVLCVLLAAALCLQSYRLKSCQLKSAQAVVKTVQNEKKAMEKRSAVDRDVKTLPTPDLDKRLDRWLRPSE